MAGRLLRVGNWEDRKHLMQERGGGRLENDSFPLMSSKGLNFCKRDLIAYWGSSSTATCQEMCSKE